MRRNRTGRRTKQKHARDDSLRAKSVELLNSAYRFPVSSGEAMDHGLREDMEARLSCDFENVRIHRDSAAEHASEQIGARAFTLGSSVYFSANQYRPENAEGRQLIAHELAHVKTQSEPGAEFFVQRMPKDYDTTAQPISISEEPVTEAAARALAMEQVGESDKPLKGLTVSDRNLEGRPGAKAALYLVAERLATRMNRGSEMDLVAQIGWSTDEGEADPQGLVTMRIDGEGNAMIELLRTGPVLVREQPADPETEAASVASLKASLVGQYALSSIEDGNVSWDSYELQRLSEALSLIPPSDRAALTGVKVERVARTPDGVGGVFEYEQDVSGEKVVNTNTLKLANKAFRGDDISFVGNADAAYAASVRLIVHEIGHAVATKTLREAGLAHAEAKRDYNQKADAQNAANASLQAAKGSYDALLAQRNTAAANNDAATVNQLDAQLNAIEQNAGPLDAAFQSAKADADQARALAESRLAEKEAAKGPGGYESLRVERFVKFVTANKIQPFTPYARDNWPDKPQEFFAEAYSLWLTDPSFLKSQHEKLYQWFAAGSYRA